MSIIATSCEGDTLTIMVRGDLSYDDHWDFRACFEKAPVNVTRYVVDLQAATHIDGSALGMLLLLQDHAGGDRKRVQLCHVSPGMRDILHDANLEDLFQMA